MNSQSPKPQQTPENNSCCHYAINTAMGIVIPVAASYAAAPYLAIAVREAFPYAYNALIGTPTTLSCVTTYIPAREYACSVAYKVGHVLSKAVTKDAAKEEKKDAPKTETMTFKLEYAVGNTFAKNIIKTAIGVAIPVAATYVAAPYLSLASREAFPYAYKAIVGTPTTLGYYTAYIPAREYAYSVVRNNGYTLAIAAAKTAHMTAKLTHAVGSSIASNIMSFFASKQQPVAQDSPKVEMAIPSR